MLNIKPEVFNDFNGFFWFFNDFNKLFWLFNGFNGYKVILMRKGIVRAIGYL